MKRKTKEGLHHETKEKKSMIRVGLVFTEGTEKIRFRGGVPASAAPVPLENSEKEWEKS